MTLKPLLELLSDRPAETVPAPARGSRIVWRARRRPAPALSSSKAVLPARAL